MDDFLIAFESQMYLFVLSNALFYISSLTLFSYGFVEFDDPRDADDAVYDLNGKDLCGKRVKVEHTIGQRRDGGNRYGRGKIFM